MAPRERNVRASVYAIVALLSLVSTTLAFAVCGDGIVDSGEQCDPPCGAGCSAGQICNELCQCEAQTPCACGTPDPTQLKFTTALPSSTATGMVTPAKCTQCAIPSHCGNDCTTDDDCITRAASVASVPVSNEQTGPDECLVGVKDQTAGDLPDNGALCAEAQNKKCTFNLAICVNEDQSGCTAGDVKIAKGSGACGRKLKKVKRPGTSSVCGALTGIKVKTKKHGSAAGTCVLKVMAKTKGKPARKDSDTVTLTCEPQPGQCPVTTTTTTTMPGPIDRGICRGPFTSGGLYYGGGLVGVPLPNQIPDLGTSYTKTCCSGTKLVLAATTAADTASEGGLRTCTSTDPTTPCLFGPPLPIPNKNNPAISTCVINKIAQNAVGSIPDCTTGVSALSVPLTSEVYLLGDIDNEPANGIQACPICRPDTHVCTGGPNDGMPCTPGDSGPDFPNGPYPTSHDCPPGPPDRLIGTLPIAFALSNGTQTKTAFTTSAQPRAFCAFCFDDVATNQFEQPPHACTSDADCTTGNFTSCRQQSAHNGAFGNSAATTISETGTAPGSLVDRMPHASTLVSVFCIPPTYNPIIDPTADLPGPGAVSLPGSAQLLP